MVGLAFPGPYCPMLALSPRSKASTNSLSSFAGRTQGQPARFKEMAASELAGSERTVDTVVKITNAASAIGCSAEQHAVLADIARVSFRLRPEHYAGHVLQFVGHGVIGPAYGSQSYVAVEQRCHAGNAAQRFGSADEQCVGGNLNSECRNLAKSLFLHAGVEHHAGYRELH